MRKALAIFKKEMALYFATPPAYVFWALTICLSSFWFWFANIERVGEASLRYVIDFMVTVLLLFGPIVTMRLIAEERGRGTVELLLTSPLREWQIVVGKFAAAATVFGTFIALSFVYAAVLILMGTPGPDPGMLAAQYIGLLLVACAVASLGLFFSSLTDSQFVAAALGVVSVIAMLVLRVLGSVTAGEAGRLLRDLTFSEHLQNFSRGIVDTTDVYYFIAVTALFLFLSSRAIEARRWARA